MGSRVAHIDVASGVAVRVSSPDRVVFPPSDRHPDGITKAGVAQYLADVSDVMIPHIADRPMTLQRFPKGLGGDDFYSKNPPAGTPKQARTVLCTYASGRQHDQLIIDDPATLVWAAQMGTLVFHPWPVRSAAPHHVDLARWDLDPATGTFTDAVAAAQLLREVLCDHGLHPVVKTSGRRGLHVVAPIVATRDFVDVRYAVIAAARLAAAREPALVCLNWWKEERDAAIFIDYNQAARDRTLAAPYSPRACADATVSMPVRWDDLGEVTPTDFTIATVPGILAEHGDAWSGVGERASLEPLLDRWYADKADGATDLPYPPEYPKMPGEPKRVQPSRARRR